MTKKLTNERKNERKNERTNEQTNERTNERTNKRTNERKNERLKERKNDEGQKYENKGTLFFCLAFVERRKYLEEIREGLRRLSGQTDSGWILLYGLGGVGKSVLAADAVRDFSLLSSCFTGKHS